MAITLDPATQNEYLVGATVVARAQGVVAAFTGTVTCKIYDGSDVEKAAATFDSPWASAIGATITIGEVGKLIVSDGGTPDGNWYVEISNGTRWLRGTFGLLGSGKDFTWSASTFATGQQAELGTVTLTASVPVTTSAPSNTAVPVINGTPQVGQVLSVTDGVWSGSPTPTYTYRWNRGGVDLPGQTAATYTLVSADEGAMIGARVTATNSAGSASASATAVGPIDPLVSALTFSGLPSPIPLYQGGTFSLASYVSGGVTPYTFSYTGTLPSGVSLDASSGVLTATSSATLGTSGSIQFHVDDSAAVASLPTFGITSSVGGTNLPFAFGHVFVEGDIPSGSYVNSDLTDWQAVPTTYWPDGSLRHAIIAGRATCSAAVLKSIALSVSATNRSGTALTETDLAAALPTTTLVAGGDSFTLNSLIGSAARHRTVCSGPVMSNWLYRRQIAGSNHLVAWFDVRLYIGGAVEIFPWVENCYLTVASPAADTRSYTLTIGGVTKFSATNLRVCHHTRIPLINNTASAWKHWSYWVGVDPQIEPKHDAAYLMATKLVPNYGWTPSAATLNGLVQVYSPNSTVGMTGFQSSGGDNSALLGQSRNYADPCYAKSSDARAFRGMMAHALSGGSWGTHFRAEASSTQGIDGLPNEPIKFSVYPNASYNDGGSPQIDEIGDNVVNAPLGNMWGWTTHQSSYGFLAWLCTGRWWFLDEMLFWATNNYLQCMVGQRDGVNGIMKSNSGAHTDRGAAWALRTLAQALAIVPATHPLHAELKSSWEANTAKYYGWVVSGSVDGGVYVNNLGCLPKYCPPGAWGAVNGDFASFGYGDCSGYMQYMLVLVFGYTSDLGLPQSATSLSNHLAVRDHAYKMPVGMAGAGDPDNWDYRWFGPYAVIDSVLNTRFMNDWNEAYDAMKATTGLVPSGTALMRVPSPTSGTNTVWADPTYLSSFFGQHLTALAYAVDHGALGAAAAWARVSAASNFASYTAGFSDIPQYGIVPRSA